MVGLLKVLHIKKGHKCKKKYKINERKTRNLYTLSKRFALKICYRRLHNKKWSVFKKLTHKIFETIFKVYH